MTSRDRPYWKKPTPEGTGNSGGGGACVCNTKRDKRIASLLCVACRVWCVYDFGVGAPVDDTSLSLRSKKEEKKKIKSKKKRILFKKKTSEQVRCECVYVIVCECACVCM